MEADPAQRDSAFDSHHMPAQPLPCGIKNSESHWGFRREQEEKFKKNFEDHKEQVPIGVKRVMREGPQQQSEMFNAPRVMGQAAPNDIPKTFMMRPPLYKVFKLVSLNRKTGIQSCRAFETFKDSEICHNPADLKELERNLHETDKDYDVDTDEETLEGVKRIRIIGLEYALRCVEKADGSVNLSMLRNLEIQTRTSRPDLYNRRGVYKIPRINPLLWSSSILVS